MYEALIDRSVTYAEYKAKELIKDCFDEHSGIVE